MEEPDKDHKAIITFLALVIMAAIVVAAVVASPKKQSDGAASADTGAATAPSSAAGSSAEASAVFKDGTYAATGSYESPGGNEKITVHVTLNNGVVTATSAVSGAQDPEAEEYQGMFIGGYKSQVVGKKVADVRLSRVSGSSLTSQGFNDAISQIENQAKA